MNDKLIGAVDKILGLNTSAIVALGGLVVAVLYAGWLVGSLYNDIRDVAHQQKPAQLCDRISECPVCDKIESLARESRDANRETRQHIDSHNAESIEWKRRIVDLEMKVYNMATQPTSRPDPFTGTMGRMLEERVKDLEQRK